MIPLSDRHLAILVFGLVYGYLVFFKRHRAIAIWAGILILILAGVIAPRCLVEDVNWNVMGIFAGTLVIAELFIHSRVPALLTDMLVDRTRTVGMAALGICFLSSALSSMVENVATVLIVAPIAVELARRLQTSPAPFLIGIAVSSNLQGTATLIGDPPSMILAGYERMTFNDFFFMDGKPGIFFAVEIGAVFSMAILYLVYRRYNQPMTAIPLERVKSWVPTWFLAAMIVALALSSFIDPDFSYLGGVVCAVFGLIGLGWQGVRDGVVARGVVKRYDWETTFFLAGVFVLVGALSRTSAIEELAQVIRSFTGESTFLTFTAIVWLSVLFSAFIDNVPYVTAMIPVSHYLAGSLNLPPQLFVFGLLIGSCLGGNITPIGASANIVSVGLAKKYGHPVGFWQFVKIGLPFTVVATLAGYLFIWFVWR